VPDAAWTAIDDTATQVLRSHLSARAVVDFDGPHGWDFAALSLGRVAPSAKGQKGSVSWAAREVLPLIELYEPFALSHHVLQDLARGAKDADLGPVEEAARRIAAFEEQVIYGGLPAAHIEGIIEAANSEAIPLKTEAEVFAQAVGHGVNTLKFAGIGGPYALVLGTDAYKALNQVTRSGQSLEQVIERVTGGHVLWSPAIGGGVLVSTRGGDFELTIGQDLAIGYARHDADAVELFFTETLAFRVLEPAAAIELRKA
ncbi:MAG TPA: bacteriocin, partial [Candidatus Hydrogenedentes bacterium]|nr:bacteriocin [Candidatus Hydrogenedentota bacterium]